MNSEMLRAAVAVAEAQVNQLTHNQPPRDAVWTAFMLEGVKYLALRQTHPAPELPDPRALAVSELEALKGEWERYAFDRRGMGQSDPMVQIDHVVHVLGNRIARLKEPHA